MTKLGEKLKELGYYEDSTYPFIYRKYTNDDTIVCIEIDCEGERYSNPTKIKDYGVYVHSTYQKISKDDIVNALKVYYEMEIDIAILKECESKDV